MWPVNLISYQLSHGGWAHLLGNFTFGLPFMLYLESKLGKKKFLEYYTSCGLFAAAFHLLLSGSSGGVIGSSGSIFGCMVGACLMYGETKEDHILAVAFLLLMLIAQLASATSNPFSMVAYWGHIGGGIGALILSARAYSPFKRHDPALPPPKGM